MTVRVFITDDSDIAAEYVRRVLEVAPDIRVVGRARGVDELMKSRGLEGADVVVLDMWMPGRAGIGVVRELSRRRGVVIVSDAPESSPLAREAIAQGALGVFMKKDLGDPSGAQRLRLTVRNALSRPASGQPVVAIVGSTGAMGAMQSVVPHLRNLQASMLIVQHMPIGREQSFADWISSLGVPCRIAKHGDPLELGRALVGPGGKHMALGDSQRVVLTLDDPIDGHRPSGTTLLASLAPLEKRVLAVILSGMGRDGADGVAKLVARGGACLVQAPSECVVSSMPESALAVSPKVRAVRVAELGPTLARAVAQFVEK